MVDKLTTERRSWLMSRVRGRDTTPELKVRKLLFAKGYRFRIHRKDLPGRPDIVLPKYRTAIFIHGCFWHRHAGCSKATTPKTRSDFWDEKFRQNMQRDESNLVKLKEMGWNTIVVWECETKDPQILLEKVVAEIEEKMRTCGGSNAAAK